MENISHLQLLPVDVDVLVPVWAALLVLHPHDVQSLVDDGGLGDAARARSKGSMKITHTRPINCLL